MKCLYDGDDILDPTMMSAGQDKCFNLIPPGQLTLLLLTFLRFYYFDFLCRSGGLDTVASHKMY